MTNLSPKREELFATIGVLMAFGAVLGWLAVPSLSQYALQAFAGALGLFFLTKRLQNAKLWHILPHTHSPELSLITFAFYLLIGATGNLNSPLLPLSFIHTFIVVFTAGPYTAIATAASAFLFHWYQADTTSTMEIVNLSIIPILLVFFLFARHQYDALKTEGHRLAAESTALDMSEHNLRTLIRSLEQRIHPILEEIHTDLTALSTNNNQLSPIQSSLDKLLRELRSLIAQHKS